MSYVWSDDHRRAMREGAVGDVLAGMTLVGAAAMYRVQVVELQRLVEEARSASEDAS